jgi:predicted transposase YbfD/YdcC
MEAEIPQASVIEHFAELDDPRRFKRRHKLLDILVIAICAAIAGPDGWEHVELFAETNEDWLRGFLELPHGVPTRHTFSRVFAALDAEQLQDCFIQWIQAIDRATEGQIIAADGKALRRSHDRSLGKKALYMVSAWASESGLVLGQTKVDEKSNEITALPELLDMLELEGCIVPADAIHCQTETARTIIEKKADYVLPVKENQPRLLDSLQLLFDDPEEMRWVACDHHRTVDKGHGRIEIRQCWTTSDPEYLRHIDTLAEWKGLRSIAMVQAERRLDEQTATTRRYFISSLESNTKQLLHAVRTHWGIENKVHWVLDIAFREDDCRI